MSQNAAATGKLAAIIPGPTGELSEGERVCNVSAGNKLQLLLTDRYGKQREFSVPQGMIRDDFVQQQKNIAERIVPKVFGQLVVHTNEPFIQTIYDLSVPIMAFVYWETLHLFFVHVYSRCIASRGYSDVFCIIAHECNHILSCFWCSSIVLGGTCPQEMEQSVVLCRYWWDWDLDLTIPNCSTSQRITSK